MILYSEYILYKCVECLLDIQALQPTLPSNNYCASAEQIRFRHSLAAIAHSKDHLALA